VLVKEHFDLIYDEKEGVDNLRAFAPEIHFDERLQSFRWPYWRELFGLALDVMREQYADWELKEPFGPPEYAIFRRIVRGGFARFQKKRPGVRVPEVWRVAEGALERREKGLPDKP
jgi:hypothetical protein